MSEDAGAAANGAQDGAVPQGQDGGGNGPDSGQRGGTGAPSATPGVDDRSAESLLADAVGADSDSEGATGKDELAKAQAELAKWKTQARENEKRAKTNAEKAKNFDAYQESQMSEQQKLAARAEAAEQAAKQAEGRYHRTLAAATYDLPPSLIDHLGDGTEEDINSRAEMFAAAINERAAVLAAAQAQAQANGQQGQRPVQNGFQRPVESLRPGGLPASDNRPRDPNQWMRDALAAKK